MATVDIQAFAASADALAVKLDSASLPGLIAKRLVVPEGAAALVRDEDGREEALRPGREVGGRFTAVLAKTGEIAVPIEVRGLSTRDGLPVDGSVEVLFEIPPRTIELRLLRETLLKDRDRLDRDGLRAYLFPAVRTVLAPFAASRAAEELFASNPRPELERLLREELEGPCFGAGLKLRELRHFSFSSEEWEKQKRTEREIEVSERLQELAARRARNEALKKQEVEEFEKVLQYEGLLKELSLRDEVDRRRKDEELKRYEGILERLGHDETKALIFLLEDERLKADLIERLIERDLTDEQVRARRATELERRIARLEKMLAEVSGAREAKLAAGGMRTRRLYAALGKSVLAFDPAAAAAREAPKETYDHGAGPLGYLRSARAVRTRDGRFVCAGAQRGVYVTREGEPRDTRELRFPWEPKGQGGVNAVAYLDGYFYATHSELGLFRWDAYGIARPEQILPDVTGRNEATRGAVVGPDGRLWFSSGAEVYSADMIRGGTDVVEYRGASAEVTSFVVTASALFAGTRSGRILRWALSDPTAPREVGLRKNEPIYMLKLAEIHGEPHLLVGAKEHGLSALSLEDGRTFDYRAEEQIRWVEGATDFVFGVSRAGYSIHVFEAGRLDREAFAIRLADRVQDISIDKERLRGEARA